MTYLHCIAICGTNAIEDRHEDAVLAVLRENLAAEGTEERGLQHNVTSGLQNTTLHVQWVPINSIASQAHEQSQTLGRFGAGKPPAAATGASNCALSSNLQHF